VRQARIVAFTVEVCCPDCGAAQPNPDNGAFPWTLDEVRAESLKQPVRTCVECDEQFKLLPQSRVSIDPLPKQLDATGDA
jgi:hypothetical protein